MSKQPQGAPPQAPVGEKRTGAGPAPPAAEAKQKARPARAKSPSAWPWGPFVRIAASTAIVFHLTAVFVPPWNMQASKSVVPMVEPGGEPRDQSGRPIRPEQLAAGNYPLQTPLLPALVSNATWHYSNLLYINNGYDFFTPDPTANHLIRYEIFNPQGERLASGQFPHRGEQWPRLFYHRHMMLVEQSGQPGMPPGWENHIADRLMEKYDGEAIRLRMFRHHLLTPEQVLAGQRIDGETTYEEIGVLERRRQRSPEITPGRGV